LLTADPVLITVYDAVAVNTIPDGAEYLLGYESTFAALAARFPHAKKTWRITTDANPSAFLDYDGIDCEHGDATPQIAAIWAYNKIAAKLGRPWVYVEVANRDLVVEELAGVKLAFGNQVDCWLAWWNGRPEVPNGIVDGVGCGTGNVACQYFNQGKFTYDASVALYDWVYPPAPTPTTEDSLMDAIHIIPTKTFPATKGSYFLNAGNSWIGPLDELSVIELQANPKAVIFESKTNSIFNAKPVVPYPAA
jgi:hypothetical protein